MRAFAAILYLCSVVPLWTAQSDFQRWAEAVTLADSQHAAGKTQETLETLRTALPIAERIEPYSLRVAMTLNRLGAVSLELGRFQDAINNYQRSVSIWEKIAPEDPGESNPLCGLSVAYSHILEYSKAEKYSRLAVKRVEDAKGQNARDLAEPLQNLGAVLHLKRQYAEAQELYRRSLQLLELQGGLPKTVGTLHVNLGTLMADMGDTEKGIEEVKRGLEVFDSVPTHIDLPKANGLDLLGVLYCRSHQWTEAEEALRRARDLLTNAFGPEHPALGPVLQNYSEVLKRLGREREAKAMRQAAMGIRRQTRLNNSLGYTVDVSAYR